MPRHLIIKHIRKRWSNAFDSDKLQGKTLAEIMVDVVNTTVNNATNFNGYSYNQVYTNILSGTANNATHFGGYTVTEIVNMVNAAASTNAITLQGKTLAEIMVDVVNTKVNSAFHADNAECI